VTGPGEPLEYEEMLVALLGLLGQEVAVHIELILESRPRPLAMLYGKLRRGEIADLTTVDGQPTGWHSGEAILFFVGESFFVMRKDDFKRGSLIEGLLMFAAGKTRIAVIPKAELKA
jgi:hypothetical protein